MIPYKIPFWLPTIVVILLFNSCVTLKPLPTELERFDRAIEVSSSELDGIYDITRLRVGSTASLRQRIVTPSIGGKPKKLNLISYELAEIENATQKYIVDRLSLDDKGNGLITTLDVEPTLIQRIFMSGLVKTLNIAKIDSDQLDPFVYEALWKNVWVGGVLGFTLEVTLKMIEKHRSRVVKDRYIQVAKEYPDYWKIVKLTRGSNEELNIGGQHVSCRVYQIDAIAKTIMVSYRETEPNYIVQDVSAKVWVSDDVPFGIVKLDGKIIFHWGAKELGIEQKPMESTVNIDLVDFKY